MVNLLAEVRSLWRDTSVGNQTAVRISQPIDQQGRRDAYQRTQIYGRTVSISNPRHQYSPINQLIDKLINISTDRQMERGTHH